MRLGSLMTTSAGTGIHSPLVELKTGPVDAVSDILFRVGPVGFVATQAAGLRRFLGSKPLANFGRDAVVPAVVSRERRNAQDKQRKHCSSHCGPPNVQEPLLIVLSNGAVPAVSLLPRALLILPMSVWSSYVFDLELFGECRHALPNQLILLSHHSSLLMPHHQFHVGQTVHLWRPALAGYAAVGAYEIRAVLPEQEGRRRYRIKSLIEPHERVVSEIELSEAPVCAALWKTPSALG